MEGFDFIFLVHWLVLISVIAFWLGVTGRVKFGDKDKDVEDQ